MLVSDMVAEVASQILLVRDDIKLKAADSDEIMSVYRFESPERFTQFFPFEDRATSSVRDQTTVFITIAWDTASGSPLAAIKKFSGLTQQLRTLDIWLLPHRCIRRPLHGIGFVFCKHPQQTNLFDFDTGVNQQIFNFLANNQELATRLLGWDGKAHLIETARRNLRYEINGQEMNVDLLEWKCATGTSTVLLEILANMELDTRFFGGFFPHPRRQSPLR